MMLVHIDQPDVAERVHNAWLRTLEDGIHTYDIYKERVSKQKVGTKEFAQAVVERVGQEPREVQARPLRQRRARATHGDLARARAAPWPRRGWWASTSSWSWRGGSAEPSAASCLR